MLLSAAGDSSARLWSMEDGRELFRFRFNEPARACRFSVGEKLAAVSTDPFMNSVSTIRLFNIAADPAEQSDEEVGAVEPGVGVGGWGGPSECWAPGGWLCCCWKAPGGCMWVLADPGGLLLVWLCQ